MIAVAVLGLAALWAPSASATGVRDVVFVGNNWDGTADVIDPHRNFRRVARINIIPDIQKRLFEIYTNPVRLAYFLAIRQAVGEGNDQYVDDMYSTKDGRLLDRLQAEPRRRGGDQFGHPPDRLALRGGRPARRPHGHLAGREARRGVRVDGERRPHPRHGHGPRGGHVPHRRLAPREQLLGGREADLQRQHRARLHPRGPAGVRLHQGRSLVPDRQREHEPDPGADRHGSEARPSGVPEDELRGPADGALAERVPGATSRSRSSTASSSTTSTRTG